MLHAQVRFPQPVIGLEIQLLLPEAVVIGIARAADVVIKHMGRAILLVDLYELREQQPDDLPIRVHNGHIQLPAEFVIEVGQRLPLLRTRPGEVKGMEGTAVHQRAAAPAAHIIPQTQGFQSVAVEQGIVPHLPQVPGHGQVPEAVVVPPGIRPQRAAGHQDLLPLDGSGSG